MVSSPTLSAFLHDLCHEIAHLFGGTFLHLARDVGVGAECEACIKVTEHAGHRFYVYAVLERQGCKCVPLRYNKDKREKPVFSMGLSVCRSHFNSFSNIETDAKI